MTMKELGIDTWPHDKLRALVEEIEDALLPQGDSGVLPSGSSRST